MLGWHCTHFLIKRCVQFAREGTRESVNGMFSLRPVFRAFERHTCIIRLVLSLKRALFQNDVPG